jgi:hypothetical protein
LYKDQEVYFKSLYGGRYYTDFYYKNYNVRDYQNYIQTKPDRKLIQKVTLGWNIGVAQIFDYSKYSRIDYWTEYLKFRYFNKKSFDMALNLMINIYNKNNDIVCLMHKNFKRETVGYQRKKTSSIYQKI